MSISVEQRSDVGHGRTSIDVERLETGVNEYEPFSDIHDHDSDLKVKEAKGAIEEHKYDPGKEDSWNVNERLSDTDRRTKDMPERPILRPFAHGFLSKEMSSCRRAYFKIVIRATILTVILTWTCLPIYWASLASSAKRTSNLEAWVINRDNGRIGLSLVNTVLAAPTSGPGSLGWKIMNDTMFPDDNGIIQSVLHEDCWLAVIVSENASNSLGDARFAGNVSYDPTSAITVYYAQARNEVASANFLVPFATSFLNNFTTTYATASAQRYLATIITDDGSINTTALNGIAQAPQTISPAVSYRMVNLRPYTAPVAQAVTLVGQIYLCIFTFISMMAHASARTSIEPNLTFTSYLTVRIFVPLIVYIPLSLNYAMINLPFHLPFGARHSYASGFFLFFAYVYLTMCALGLALEAMVTILSTKFVPFFLVLLIIVNISTAAIPPELQPTLYAYGAGFQFWNMEQAVRTIIFNTNSHLGKNALVLLAWTILSCGTLSSFTFFLRRRDVQRSMALRALHAQRSGGGGNSGSVSRRYEHSGIGMALRVLMMAVGVCLCCNVSRSDHVLEKPPSLKGPSDSGAGNGGTSLGMKGKAKCDQRLEGNDSGDTWEKKSARSEKSEKGNKGSGNVNVSVGVVGVTSLPSALEP